MAKSQLFTNPFIKFIFYRGGAFPVRRGYNDQEAFKTAETILGRGGTVLMYAEGGRSRTGDLGEPKRGVGKLALESGAPVVPVAIHGSAHVRGWRRLRFPKVTIQFGEPMAFPVKEDPSRDEQQQVANQVFDQVRAMYVALEEKGRRGVLRSLREGLPATSPSRTPPTCAAAADARGRVSAPDLFLVAGLELGEELGVVPWDDQGVGIGLPVLLELVAASGASCARQPASAARSRPVTAASHRRRRRRRRNRVAADGGSARGGRRCGRG